MAAHLMDGAVRQFKQLRVAAALKKMDAERVAAGHCRHCDGPVPCWSPFGDVRVGVRHPWKGGRIKVGCR